jgi:hypothetical protein
MVTLLSESLWGHWDPRSATSMATMAGVEVGHLPAAISMATNALAIANEPDREHGKRCRGAILEALSESLARVRTPNVLTEQRAWPFPHGWDDEMSDPIDLVVDDDGQEFYECKTNVLEIESKHVAQFQIIDEICLQRHLCGFITLQARDILIDWLSGFSRGCALYGYTLEDFAEMASGKPTLRIEAGTAA